MSAIATDCVELRYIDVGVSDGGVPSWSSAYAIARSHGRSCTSLLANDLTRRQRC